MFRLIAAAVIAAIPIVVGVQFIRSTTGEPVVGYAGLVEVQDRAVVVAGVGRTVRQVIGAEVLSIDGETIGDVASVLRDSQGEIVAITVAHGGLFGLGADELVVRLDQLRQHIDGFMIEMSAEQATTLPRFRR